MYIWHTPKFKALLWSGLTALHWEANAHDPHCEPTESVWLVPGTYVE